MAESTLIDDKLFTLVVAGAAQVRTHTHQNSLIFVNLPLFPQPFLHIFGCLDFKTCFKSHFLTMISSITLASVIGLCISQIWV